MAWSNGGVELVIEDCFEPHQVICEGFLSLPHGRSQLATLVDCSWFEGSTSWSGCVAPAEGLALNCQLYQDYLARKQVNLGKKILCHILPRILSCDYDCE